MATGTLGGMVREGGPVLRLSTVGVAVLAGIALYAPPAAASSPPSAPTQLVASDLTERNAVLTWQPSTDDVGVTGYEVWQVRGRTTTRQPRTTETTTQVAGLQQGTTYRYFVTAVDTDGQRSGASRPVEFTTPPGDTIPPTVPGQPVVSELAATSVRLTWAASVDANGVYSYEVLRVVPDRGWAASSGTNWVVLRGLTPGTTYTFQVVALDILGNYSPWSPVVTRTTPLT